MRMEHDGHHDGTHWVWARCWVRPVRRGTLLIFVGDVSIAASHEHFGVHHWGRSPGTWQVMFTTSHWERITGPVEEVGSAIVGPMKS